MQCIQDDAREDRHIRRIERDVETAPGIGNEFGEFHKVCPGRENRPGRTARGLGSAIIHREFCTRPGPGIIGKQPEVVFLARLQSFDGDARARSPD